MLSRGPSRRSRVGALVGLVGLVMLLALAGSTPAFAPAQGPGEQAADQGGPPPAAPVVRTVTLDSAQPEVGAAVPVGVEVLRVAQLQPGVDRRLDVSVVNPNAHGLVLTGVDVQVSGVRAPRASAARPCGVADFRTSPARFDGVLVGPGASVSLSRAGIASRQWPRVAMLDTAANQDGCQEAQLVLDVRVEGKLR